MLIWEDTIKVDLKEIGSDSVDFVQLGQIRVQSWALVNMVINLKVP
jgi:hypothetical protein